MFLLWWRRTRICIPIEMGFQFKQDHLRQNCTFHWLLCGKTNRTRHIDKTHNIPAIHRGIISQSARFFPLIKIKYGINVSLKCSHRPQAGCYCSDATESILNLWCLFRIGIRSFWISHGFSVWFFFLSGADFSHITCQFGPIDCFIWLIWTTTCA